jgi:hypothetical protein
MKTFVFIIQTVWLTDVDFGVQAENIQQARELAEKEWPPKSGHKIFYNYSY